MNNTIKESARGYDLIPITDEHLKTGKLFFNDEVNTASCNDAIQNLLFMAQDDSIEKISFLIASPGGDVQAGLCLYDTLRLVNSIKPVTTICVGLCASMGSILLLAGNNRLILPHGKVMVHGPSFGNHNVAGKKVEELAAELKDLENCSEILEEIIAERTKKSAKEIKKICSTDSYFTAEESIAFGLTTKIIESITEVI